MACKLDVDLVINQVVQRKVKNITNIKDGYADTTVDFNKRDVKAIDDLNKQWGEKVITFTTSGYNDVSGSITISISEQLYDRYIKAIDIKREQEKLKNNEVVEEQTTTETQQKTPIEKEIEEYLGQSVETIEDKKREPLSDRESHIKTLFDKLNNLISTLGISIPEFTEIYYEQQKINALNKQLENLFLTEEERNIIQNEINALKAKGVDKKALAVADILNRTINIADTENLQELTEEVMHFIVDIIEQKYPELYKELYDKSWSYKKYKEVKENYKDQYKTEEEFRKETIAQILTDYLVNNDTTESDYQNEKTETFWSKIKDSLNNLFFNTKGVNVDSFKSFADKLLNSNLITEEDIKYLNSKGLFYSRKTEKTAEELRDNFLSEKANIELREVLVDNEKKSRYFYKNKEVAKRVSDVVADYYKKLFRNNDIKDNALNEQVREEGVELHSLFQLTFLKFVAENGDVRQSSIEGTKDFKDLEVKYPKIAKQIEDSVKELISLHPNSYFLTELPIVSKNGKIGGTLDLVIINKKNAQVSIYDWKTKKGVVQDKTTKAWGNRINIPWWNVGGWRIQLREYHNILRDSYGVSNFGQIRMIPIMTFTSKVSSIVEQYNSKGEKVKVNKNEYVLDRIEIASFDKNKIDAKKKQLLPLVSEFEKSDIESINTLASKIRGVIGRNIETISKNYKLKLDLTEENTVLEELFSVLMTTNNIETAAQHIAVIILDVQDFLEELKNKDLTELSANEIFNLSQTVKSFEENLSIYEGIETITRDLFGKNATDIVKEYKDLEQQFKNTPTEALRNKLEESVSAYKTARDFLKISNKIKEQRKDLDEKYREFMELFSNKQGVHGLFDVEVGDSWIDKFINNIRGLYSLNFKTAKVAQQLLLKAHSIIADKNKQDQRKMYELRDEFTKGLSTNNLEELFKNLLVYNPINNDYYLIPKINPEFYAEFDSIKEQFEKGFENSGELFYLTKEYKVIENWLNDNLNIPKYQEALKKYKESHINKVKEANKVLKNTDPISYEILIQNKEKQFDYFNDVFKSPAAWKEFNKILYLNESKWESKEHKKLNKSELAIYNHFRSIYAKAQSVGYVQGWSNINRIPYQLREKEKLKRSLNPAEIFFEREDDQELYQNIRIDPVTGREIHEVPIYMTDFFDAKKDIGTKKLSDVEIKRLEFLKVKKDLSIKEREELKTLTNKTKGDRLKSIDLFQVYLDFQYNLNRFEELSNIENMLLALVEVENNKTKELSKGIFGNVGDEINADESTNLLSTTKKQALKKTIFNTLYNIRYEPDIPIPIKRIKNAVNYASTKKAYQWVNNYTTALFIQGTLKLSGAAALASSVVAGTATSKNMEGSKYLRSIISRINPLNSKSSYRNEFNHLLSQKEVEHMNENRTEFIKKALTVSKQYAVDHLRLVDQFIQNSVFDASLDSYLVIDNKIVNRYDYIHSLIPNLDNLEYTKAREEERKLTEKYKDKTLSKFLEKNTKDGKTDISKIDKDSKYTFEQNIRLESKKIIGNMTDEDIYSMRWGFMGGAWMKFKAWMPELYKTFFGGVNWREEGKRYEAGRFTSLVSSLITPVDSNEDTEYKTYIISALWNATKLIQEVSAFTIGKDTLAIKNLNARYKIYVEEAKSLKLDNIPTKKEYIDLRLQEARNAKNFLLLAGLTHLLSGILGVLSGDDDEKESPLLYAILGDFALTDPSLMQALLRMMYSMTVKGLIEIDTLYDLREATKTISKLAIPQLSAVGIAGLGIGTGISAATNIMTGGTIGTTKNIKYTVEALPIIKPFIKNVVKYTDGTEFGEIIQEILNVNKNFKKKAKKKGEADNLVEEVFQ